MILGPGDPSRCYVVLNYHAALMMWVSSWWVKVVFDDGSYTNHADEADVDNTDG